MADKKIYRTAGGREVDMGQLALKNEKVRAVGNMNVNARGDVVDSKNNLTSSRATQVNKSYRKQIGNVPQDVPVTSNKREAVAPAEESITGLDEVIEQAETVEKPKAKAKAKAKTKETKSGLAGAIAKASNKD